jgi:hypothetical protein
MDLPTYKLDGTAIYATLEPVSPSRTRCTFRHRGHEVSGVVNVRLVAFEFAEFISLTDSVQYENPALATAIDQFPDWNQVVASAEDDWVPVD